MEQIITCEICYLEYHFTDVIPKSLHCGHTFCSPCITKLIAENPCCPKCKKQIEVSENSLSVNYALLAVVEAFKSSKNLEMKLMSSTQQLKNKFLTRKEHLLKKKTEIGSSFELIKNRIASCLGVIEKSLTKLDELNASNEQEIDIGNTRKVLTELEEDFKRTENVVLCSFSQLKLSNTISYSEFEGPGEFLNEIYERLQNSENIYLVHQIDGRIKYGKASSYDNKLVFHSLTLAEAPKDSSLILLDDLKKGLGCKKFFTFLKIPINAKNVSRLVIIEMFEGRLTSNFIKLCTGECGQCYKGSSIKKKEDGNCWTSLINVETFADTDCETKRLVDYKYCGEEIKFSIPFKKDELFVFGFTSKQGFQIVRVTRDGSWEGAPIGKVISPSDLHEYVSYDDYLNLKIIDSGILFDV